MEENQAPKIEGIRFLTRKPEASMVPRKLFTWHNAMFVREEDLMAMSLLYALLGVNDTKDLEQIELKHKAYDAAKLKALETNAEFQDEKRALKYRDLRS